MSTDSRELLLPLLLAERDKQLTHFESADTKAGLLLGVSGIVVTVSPDIAQPLLTLSLTAALLAGGFALAALWPRRYPVLNAARLRDYAGADPELTRRVVLDTTAAMVVQASHVLARKTWRLKASVVAIAVAAATLAVGVTV